MFVGGTRERAWCAWGCGCALATALLIVASAAADDPYRVIVTPVLHEGDPAPEMPGFTCYYFLAPRIDGAGNVLLNVLLSPGGGLAAYYGPPDALTRVAWEGMQAPDLPPGVVISWMYGGVDVSENGLLAVSGDLQGPGIVHGVNDMGVWYGPPGDLHPVVQVGDPAPGTEPDTVFYDFGVEINDVGGMLIGADLAGPSVTTANDRGYWIGTPGDLQLAWRKGMQAPGTEAGVTFTWGDLVYFNEANWISLRCGLTGPGISDLNDDGFWAGPPGALIKVAWYGDQVPGFWEGVTYKVVGGIPFINASGDVLVTALIQGPGVDQTNDYALFSGLPGAPELVAREDDPAPEAGPGVVLASPGATGKVNNQDAILYGVTFAGPGIDDTNKRATYFGPPGQTHLEMRDSAPAPFLPTGTLLSRVVFLSSMSAMNDVGDVMGPSELTGPGVTASNKVVLWRRNGQRGKWHPLLRSGDQIGARTVYWPDAGSCDGFCDLTGGADGQPQSMNDAGDAVVNVEFSDGTTGVYYLKTLWPGDGNCDGVIDNFDINPFVLALTDPAAYAETYPGCDARNADLNGDGAVDNFDINPFVRLLVAP